MHPAEARRLGDQPGSGEERLGAPLAVEVEAQDVAEARAAEGPGGERVAALARALEARDDVRDVRYPGLPGDRGHALAARTLGGERFGSVLCFDLDSEGRAQAFLAGARLIAEATSFGGVHSSAERRLRWGIDDVSPGFIRVSTGIEHAEDLVADVCAALDATATR